jgi:hypothetical protein
MARKKLKFVSSLYKLHCNVSTPAVMLKYADGIHYTLVLPRIPLTNSKLTNQLYVQCRTK